MDSVQDQSSYNYYDDNSNERNFNTSSSTLREMLSPAAMHQSSTHSPPLSSSLADGNYTDDYGYEHEEDLYQVPLGIVIMLSTFYGGISLAAVAGNGLVLWVVTVSRRMRTVTNLFIANLALADIIIGLFAIPFQFQAALLQRWNLPDFMCAFCPFVQVLSVNVSVFTLSAIALDRYRAVLHPLSARASKRKATLAIVTIWAVGIILALPTEIDFRVHVKTDRNGPKPFCDNTVLSYTFRKYYLLGLVVIQYFLPLCVISGAYIRMATRLWGATAPGNAENNRDAAILRNKKKELRVLEKMHENPLLVTRLELFVIIPIFFTFLTYQSDQHMKGGRDLDLCFPSYKFHLWLLVKAIEEFNSALYPKPQVIKMLAVVVLLFALCWLPIQSYNFFRSFIPAINNYQYINIIWFVFHWLAMSNSCCNPFIYAIYNDKFQREFRARLRAMKFCTKNRADSPNSEVSDFDRSKIRASYRFHDARHQRGTGKCNDPDFPSRLNQHSFRNNQPQLYRGPRRNLNNHRDSSLRNNLANKGRTSKNGSLRFEEETALTVQVQVASPQLHSCKRSNSMESRSSISNNDFS